MKRFQSKTIQVKVYFLHLLNVILAHCFLFLMKISFEWKFMVECGEDHLTWKVGMKRNFIMLRFGMLSLGEEGRKHLYSVETVPFSPFSVKNHFY